MDKIIQLSNQQISDLQTKILYDKDVDTHQNMFMFVYQKSLLKEIDSLSENTLLLLCEVFKTEQSRFIKKCTTTLFYESE